MGFEEAQPALKVGWMVETSDDHRRLGKIAEIRGDRAAILYFHSLSATYTGESAVLALRRAYLSPQTRVYFRRPGEDRWRIGRIRNYLVESDASVTYEVRTPNRADFDVHESDLFARCFILGSDPAEVLALGGAEAQIWHDARWGAREVLTDLRSAANGMTGLASASIELVPHQAEAVKRVLLDPLQRYLLADEVGLGKTIEAGAIIRQTLTDRSSDDVLVAVPAPLVGQWRGELAARFGAEADGRRLRVVAFEDLHFQRPAHLLVVDEAHRCAPDSTAFAQIDRLAQASNKLLLLSATPVVGAEAAFLNLLRWLDADRWERETLESFRRLVQKSQDHGRLLLGLRADASPFLLKQRVAAAGSAFPHDETVQELVRTFADAPPERRPEICADLRDHVADVYRIHHRLVRARRSDLEGWEFKPRGPATVREEAEGSDADADVSVALEDWRAAAVLALDAGAPAYDLAERYGRFVELAGRGAHALVEIEDDAGLFEGEKGLADALRRIARSADPRQRAAFVATVVERQIGFLRKTGPAPKIVVFTSDAPDILADILAERLGEAFSFAAGNRRTDLQRFERSPEVRVLLLGQDGEEGLNLHFADAVVHADMPLRIGRIEQRIGRLDRFGRTKGPIRHVVVLPSDDEYGPWSTWLETLKTGLGMFDRSVSDIQFALDDIESAIKRSLLMGGGPGDDAREGGVQTRLAEERQKLDEQYALDQMAFARESGRELVERMEEAEANEGRMARDVERLLVQLLGFERRPAGPDTFLLAWTKDTQLPAWPWRSIFAPAMERPSTWRRRVAERSPGVALLRPGDALVDALDRLLDWDDRGSAFATWRYRPGAGDRGDERIVARLCWRISPAPIGKDGLEPEDDSRGLDRRAASFLRPSTIVQNLFADLTNVDDLALLEILAEPYRTHAEDGRGRDYNLGSRPAWLDAVLDDAEFVRLCRDAQRSGHERLLGDEGLRAATQKAAQAAFRDADRRRRRTSNGSRAETEQDRAVATAVANPRYRLDCIGIFVVAGYVPKGLVA